MELVPTGDGDFEERPAPAKLASNQVTMLLPYGSLFFAAAIDFEEEAPKVGEAKNAAVIVILRGRHNLGSTAIAVFERYAKAIQENGGRLLLAEVGESVRAQLERTGAIAIIGTDNIIPSGDRMYTSLRQIYDDAQAWIDMAASLEERD